MLRLWIILLLLILSWVTNKVHKWRRKIKYAWVAYGYVIVNMMHDKRSTKWNKTHVVRTMSRFLSNSSGKH